MTPTHTQGIREQRSISAGRIVVSSIRAALLVVLLLCRPVAILARYLAIAGVLMCVGFTVVRAPNFQLLPMALMTAGLWLLSVLIEAAIYLTDGDARPR